MKLSLMHLLTLIFYRGTAVPTGATVVDQHFAVLGYSNAKWLIPTVIVAAALIVFSGLFVPGLSRLKRNVLAGLRIAILLIVAALLLRPTIRVTFDRTVRPTLPILIDASSSIATADKRVDKEDQVRALIAQGKLDPAKGLAQAVPPTTQPDPTRESLIQSAFTNPKLNLRSALQKRFDLEPYQFSDTLAEISDPDWIARLTDTGRSTAIGDSLKELLAKSRGRPVAGILLVTDGRNNAGSPAAAAAEIARAQGVKLFIYGVGTVNSKDIIVAGIQAPETAFVDKSPDKGAENPPPGKPDGSRLENLHEADVVPVIVRVTARGYDGGPAELVLKLGTKEVGRQTITLRPYEQSIPMKFIPSEPGHYDLTASIEPRSDEENKTNNSSSTPITVTDKKIRVLMVDSSPRWEFKYVLATLQHDSRVTVHCMLQDGDPGITDDTGPYIKAFPADGAALLNDYDVIVIGDVNPALFTGPQMDGIKKFVSEVGGGLLVVPGRRFGIESLMGTPIGEMLPVKPAPPGVQPANGTTPIALELTPAGRRSAALKLAPDEADSARIWTRIQDQTPIYWDVPVIAPAAEVLLVDKATKNPVLAVSQSGRGQVMFLGTDNTWRWRQNQGEKSYAAFWEQIVQRLALPRLLGTSKQVQWSVDNRKYDVGETVTVYANLYDKSFAPRTDEKVPATVTQKDGDRTFALSLTPVAAGQPGAYRASFIAPAVGHYEVRLDGDPSSDPQLIEVSQSSAESIDTALDDKGLTALAQITGGRFFREEDLKDLPAAIAAVDETVRSTTDVDLGAMPVWFAVIVLLATVEWVLRKIFQVK